MCVWALMAFSNISFSLTTSKYSLINVDGGDGEHIEFVEEKNDDYDFDLSVLKLFHSIVLFRNLMIFFLLVLFF